MIFAQLKYHCVAYLLPARYWSAIWNEHIRDSARVYSVVDSTIESSTM